MTKIYNEDNFHKEVDKKVNELKNRVFSFNIQSNCSGYITPNGKGEITEIPKFSISICGGTFEEMKILEHHMIKTFLKYKPVSETK